MDSISAYRKAKTDVIAAGYDDELEWQAQVQLEQLTPSGFLCDVAFVICNSGMRNSVIAGLWPRLRDDVFGGFEDLARLKRQRAKVTSAALRVLNSPPKITSMLDAADRIHTDGWDHHFSSIQALGIDHLRTFRYMGPIIVFHLAKNIGLQVAKPDRHLVRIAELFGETDVQAFCAAIAAATGDSIPVVDLVWWRYAASVNHGYLGTLGAK